MRRLFIFLFFALCQWLAQPALAGLIAEKAYLRDVSGSATIDNLPAADFRAYAGNLQMMFETQPVWLRLSLAPLPVAGESQGQAGPQVLRIGPHALDQIELYERVAGQWVQQIAGDQHANTRSVCPDDHHCFALNPGRTTTDPLYLRIQSPGLASVDTDVLQGQALVAAVSSRVTTLTVSLTVALGLLCIGLFLAWNGRTPLFLVYCLFQVSVILFLATNTGLIARILPAVSPETHSFLGQASLIVRYFFMLLAGWLLLIYYQPNRLYRRLTGVLCLNSAVSMGVLLMGHVQTALLLNMLNFYCIPWVQIYGVSTTRDLPTNSRYILLTAYGMSAALQTIGSLSLLGMVVNPQIYSVANSGGDWRLNGMFVGFVFFLLVFSEERNRRAKRMSELEVLRRRSEEAHVNEEKLNERSALIDMLTHELKNPLGTIQFSLATLKRALSGDADSLQRVQRIDVSLKRMDDLIEHVADSNKIDRTSLVALRELQPAQELVTELLENFPALDRFDVDIQEGSSFLADPKMLAIILENLLSNAWKYSLAESRITIAVTQLTGAEASSEVAPNLEGFTCFEVGNEVAPGQEPDESRLFERYYRHPDVQGLPGMGIGLSLVQSAAKKIGASVGFRKQGARVFFHVRIPN